MKIFFLPNLVNPLKIPSYLNKGTLWNDETDRYTRFNEIFSYIFPLCPGRDVKKDGHANKSPGSQMYLGWECRNRDYKVKGVIGQKIFFLLAPGQK